jgi:hypothetical protein
VTLVEGSSLSLVTGLLLQVLEISARILGKEHPDTLTAMNNLALTYYVLGKAQEGKKLLLQVLESSTRILTEELGISNVQTEYREHAKFW